MDEDLETGNSGAAGSSCKRKILRTIAWVLLSVGIVIGTATTGLYLFAAAWHRETKEEAIHIALLWDARTGYLNHRLSNGEPIHENWYAQRIYGGICRIGVNKDAGESCPELDLVPSSPVSRGNDTPVCAPVLIRGDFHSSAGARLFSVVDLRHTHRLLRDRPVAGNFSQHSVGLPPPWADRKSTRFDYTIEPIGMCGSVFVYRLRE